MSNEPQAEAPVARRDPTTREIHGVRTVDDYAWMRHDAAALRDYLAAERSYYDTVTSHSGPLRDILFAEMSHRLPSTDSSVSWQHGDWLYYTRTLDGKEYPQFMRQGSAPDAESRVLLDLNELA